MKRGKNAFLCYFHVSIYDGPVRNGGAFLLFIMAKGLTWKKATVILNRKRYDLGWGRVTPRLAIGSI